MDILSLFDKFSDCWTKKDYYYISELRKEFMRELRCVDERCFLKLGIIMHRIKLFLEDSLSIYFVRTQFSSFLAEEREYMEACYYWCKQKCKYFCVRYSDYKCVWKLNCAFIIKCARQYLIIGTKYLVSNEIPVQRCILILRVIPLKYQCAPLLRAYRVLSSY